jgi:hypothetical protein
LEYAEPIPSPPLNEVYDSDAARTVAQRPDLFRIVTPINVDWFEELLTDHPNQPFVQSVCQSLHQGFWPWADTSDESYPSINDNSTHTCSKSDNQKQFIEDQICEEIRLGCVSESLGTKLYPGMYSVPMHTVPKPNSDKLRLVVDHTAGDYSLNSMIDRDAIKGTKLDGLQSLGASLLCFRKEHPNVKLVMFKSDVSQAFRHLPMHPLWQVKQILTVRGQRHMDCNNKSVVHAHLSAIKTAGHLHLALNSNREGSSAHPLLATIADVREDAGRGAHCAPTIGIHLLHLPAVHCLAVVHRRLPHET